jgi:hypothetical protein
MQLAVVASHCLIDSGVASRQNWLESQQVNPGAQAAALGMQADRFTHVQLVPVQSSVGFEV